jgi:hypothetical protein
MRCARNIFVGKSERNKQFGIPRVKLKDNIKMDLKKCG